MGVVLNENKAKHALKIELREFLSNLLLQMRFFESDSTEWCDFIRGKEESDELSSILNPLASLAYKVKKHMGYENSEKKSSYWMNKVNSTKGEENVSSNERGGGPPEGYNNYIVCSSPNSSIYPVGSAGPNGEDAGVISFPNAGVPPAWNKGFHSMLSVKTPRAFDLTPGQRERREDEQINRTLYDRNARTFFCQLIRIPNCVQCNI